ARAQGLVGCRRCAKVWTIGTPTCARCGAKLQSRDGNSLKKVWTWWFLGLLAYIPANLYPMLETRTLLARSDDTIIAGAIKLGQHGAFAIAAIILIASVVIPVAKFLAVAYLALSVQYGGHMSRKSRHWIYEFVEFIGRWSMIDVFVVAVLASLVQLNVVASVTAGPAALSFALSVIFTMIAAQSLDTRLVWDQDDAEA
ncbi:MAG: paraquat-inducible protein A, partial [Paracoccaceae bacterium]